MSASCIGGRGALTAWSSVGLWRGSRRDAFSILGVWRRHIESVGKLSFIGQVFHDVDVFAKLPFPEYNRFNGSRMTSGSSFRLVSAPGKPRPRPHLLAANCRLQRHAIYHLDPLHPLHHSCYMDALSIPSSFRVAYVAHDAQPPSVYILVTAHTSRTKATKGYRRLPVPLPAIGDSKVIAAGDVWQHPPRGGKSGVFP
jgi:hypothetical protein